MSLADMLLFALALAGAYTIRFDFNLDARTLDQMLGIMPFVVLLKLAVFYFSGLYKGMWRYTGLREMFRLARAAVLASLIISAYILFYYRFQGFSRGVFVLDCILTIALTGGLRVFIRILHQRGFLNRKNSSSLSKTRTIKAILVGAGDAAEKSIREIHDNPHLSLRVVGFVDDSEGKQGKSIHGISVLGRVDDLPELALKHNIDEIIIAMPSATGKEMRRVVEICKNTGVTYKTLPGLGELIEGKVTVKALRDVNYADLLSRPAVSLDMGLISDYLRDKTVLVTGPGGSIGSELCRQIVRYNPRHIILFDSSEPSLYAIQMELEHQVRYLNYTPVLGAVQKTDLAAKVFEKHRPDVVFHAAAYKHVPMLEINPWQAVWNNVRAAQNMMEMSVQHGVGRFILVSTDKAVRPTNVMGASKRCCEKLMYAYTGGTTSFMAVRFGNVVGSAGSVVPLFRRQIELGGPVTVTHPEMTRYFMTIPESCQLILQAAALGRGGELFILEMGTPVKIKDMAEDLIRLSGKEPGRDIQIVFGKPRPGEKLYEELITKGEDIVPSSHEQIMMLKSAGCYDGYGDQEGYNRWLFERLDELYMAADSYQGDEIRQKLKVIVPEYDARESGCVV